MVLLYFIFHNFNILLTFKLENIYCYKLHYEECHLFISLYEYCLTRNFFPICLVKNKCENFIIKVLFKLQIFGGIFLKIFFYYQFQIKFFDGQRIYSMYSAIISFFKAVLGLILWVSMWTILLKVLCVLENNVYCCGYLKVL